MRSRRARALGILVAAVAASSTLLSCNSSGGGSLAGLSEIIDASGDGAGRLLDDRAAVAVDSAGNVYVSGAVSDRVFRIAPAGVITAIVDSLGAGPGDRLNMPLGVAVDASDNVLRFQP